MKCLETASRRGQWMAGVLLFSTLPGAFGQDQVGPSTGTKGHRAFNQMGGVADATPLEPMGPGAGALPPPPSNARPVPMPEARPGQPRPAPGSFLNLPHSRDLLTGQESFGDLSGLGGAAEQWMKGREVGPVSQDDLNKSWTADLIAINSASYPWSTQCRLYFDDVLGNTWVGSATLIDARTVITAGHCVHQGSGGSWHTNFRIYPVWDGDSDAYGAAQGTAAASFTGWTVNGYWEGDMGFIRLDRPVGFLTGWLGYGYNTSDSFMLSTTFNMAGYPGAGSCYPGAPHQMYYGYGTFDWAFPDIMETDHNWSCDIGGMSGSGVYNIDAGARYVMCNQSYKYIGLNRVGMCRMTATKYNYMSSTFGPGGYPSGSIDLVALDSNATPISLNAGDALSSLDYLVSNAALFDPPSQSYSVDVYLSTNDYISSFDTLIQSHSFTWDFGQKSSVRVNVGSPPTIPIATAAGNYWVGVIVNVADADGSNNDSSGWDATPITVSPAPDDGYEDNDTLATAAAIGPGTYGSLVCLDPDFFKVYINRCDSIEYTISFIHANGDLDCELYAMDGTWLDGSYGVTNSETVSFGHVPASDYYAVKVYGYAGATNNYSLTATRILSGGSMAPYGVGLAGSGGHVPMLNGGGCSSIGETVSFDISNGLGGANGYLGVSLTSASTPLRGGLLLLGAPFDLLPITLGGSFGVPGAGWLSFPVSIPPNPGYIGGVVYFQVFVMDAGAVRNVAMSRGLAVTIGG